MFRRAFAPSIAGIATLSRNKASVSPAVATVVDPVYESQQQDQPKQQLPQSKVSFQELTSLRLLYSLLSKEVAPTWNQFSAAAGKKYPHLNLVGIRAKLEKTGVNFPAPQEREKIVAQKLKAKQHQADLEAKKKAEEAAREQAAKLFKQTLNARVLYTDLVKARGGLEPTWKQFAAEIQKVHQVQVGSELMRQLQRVPGIVFLTKEKAKTLYQQELTKMEAKQTKEREEFQAEFAKQKSALILRHNAERQGIENRHKKVMESLKEDTHPTDRHWLRDPLYVSTIKKEQARALAELVASQSASESAEASELKASLFKESTSKKVAPKKKRFSKRK